jgi:hypothetical protein
MKPLSHRDRRDLAIYLLGRSDVGGAKLAVGEAGAFRLHDHLQSLTARLGRGARETQPEVTT